MRLFFFRGQDQEVGVNDFTGTNLFFVFDDMAQKYYFISRNSIFSTTKFETIQLYFVPIVESFPYFLCEFLKGCSEERREKTAF